MGTRDIISEINKPPVIQRLTRIELTLKKIGEEEKQGQFAKAAEVLYDDYLSDPGLTAFSNFDLFSTKLPEIQ